MFELMTDVMEEEVRVRGRRWLMAGSWELAPLWLPGEGAWTAWKRHGVHARAHLQAPEQHEDNAAAADETTETFTRYTTKPK